MHSEILDYKDGEETFEAYVAYDDANKTKRPCVLVAHAWAGQRDFEKESAQKLAELGYVGFAIDMYGKGKRGSNPDENTKLMTPFVQDRNLLRQRINVALETAKNHPSVDANKIAVIGYCFGGLCSLDLARSVPAGLLGAVSFHGLFSPPNIGEQKPISAKILILHGYDDPMAKPADMLAVADELTQAKADWQLHAYGHTKHGFTNPASKMPDLGIEYNESAAKRSWIALQNFLTEIFA